MPIIFDSKDSVFFVGGRGTKEGDAYAGGGCTKDFWGDLKNPSKTLADVMDANGKPLSSILASLGSTACDVVNNGSGKVRITKAGQGYFTDCCAGLIANAYFAAVYTDGRYEVLAIDGANGDWVDIDETYSADTTCGVYVGGAFPYLQSASDNTDANSTTPHNVYILTNKNETFPGVEYHIDIDAGGGDTASNTHKRIIGINDNGVELADGTYVEIDANSQACHVINIEDVDNVELRHIYTKDADATHDGFEVISSVNMRGTLLSDCKSTGCRYGIYSPSSTTISLIIMKGHYVTSSYYNFYIASRNTLMIDVVLENTGGGYIMALITYGSPIVSGCIFKSNGTSMGIYNAATVGAATIRNSVFYDVINGIRLNHASATLVEYNNIYIVHAKATGKVIRRNLGTIVHSDYSCLWALDGAPTASGRWGGDGKPEHAIEEDPDFVDAANGRFRPRKPNVLRGGKPDIAGNTTEMGAVLQEYEFARRAKAANLGRLQIIR